MKRSYKYHYEFFMRDAHGIGIGGIVHAVVIFTRLYDLA
jgi:hypothetical protein